LPTPSDKTALITGASSGLGVEFAIQLAARGYHLILVARREERLEQVADKLRSDHGVEVIVFPADLSKLEEIERVISVINTTPNLELLVNNAGFGINRRFINADPEKELALLQVHMTAPVMLCRAVLPGMAARNYGVIINVSSLAGIIPIRSVLYGSSKSFLISFSEALQEELHDSGIRVQALCPGFTFTEFHDTSEYTRFNRQNIPGFLWLTSEKVVTNSLKSLTRQKVICIPGNLYGFIGVLARNSLTADLIKSMARFVLRKRRH
jgi:short-subunit dehydrogenase